MGLFQEAAIFTGDHFTQPIRAKVVGILTGNIVTVKKVVEDGVLMNTGQILPESGPDGALWVSIRTHDQQHAVNYHAKRVSWELVPQEKSNP